MLFGFVIGSLFLLANFINNVQGDGKCKRPIVPHSNSTSSTPLLEDGQEITVTCDIGYSNGHTQSTASVCKNGILDPPVPLCYADCNRPVIPHSDATSPTPPLLHGEGITVTCNTGYSNGETRTTTSVCRRGIIYPPIPSCFADCIPRKIPHSNHSTQQPNILHSHSTLISCWKNYSMGPESQSIKLSCNDGYLGDENVKCYENCPSVQAPLNGEIIKGSKPFFHGDVLQFRCSENYTLVGQQEIVCGDGSWDNDPPTCQAKCLRPVVPHSDATSQFPLLDHGETITVLCNQRYTFGESRQSTSECDSGTLYPPLQTCYKDSPKPGEIVGYVTAGIAALGTITSEEQCRRPVILHSNSTSPTPPLNDWESITVTCFLGYSNGQSHTSTSVCKNGALSPPVPECYADCVRPVIPHSDAVSPTPELLHGELITVTCDTDYFNGKTRSTTSQCENGLINPAILVCDDMSEEQCERPVVLHSNSTSATPLLNDGESITVTCFLGYSNGHSQSSTSVCKNGALSPPVPECYADCLRPVIPHSDAVSPTPALLHLEFITVTCDINYSNGKTRSTTSQCKNGLIEPAILACYADCVPRIIPHSDHSTQQPNLLNGQATTINCCGNYSMGPESQSVTLTCYDGELNDETVTCYENCKPLQSPIDGEISTGSPPFFHHKKVGFKCNTNFTLIGEQEILCTDGSWSSDPPTCLAKCSRPVIPHSDSTSPIPLLDHGESITVTCDLHYSDAGKKSSTSVCDAGTLEPLPTIMCYKDSMSAPTIGWMTAFWVTAVLLSGFVGFHVYPRIKERLFRSSYTRQ